MVFFISLILFVSFIFQFVFIISFIFGLIFLFLRKLQHNKSIIHPTTLKLETFLLNLDENFLKLETWKHLLFFIFMPSSWIILFIYSKVYENNKKADAYFKKLNKPVITYNNFKKNNIRLIKGKVSFKSHYNLKKYKTINRHVICNKPPKKQKKLDYNSIEYIDMLSGLEFETYMSKLLPKLGYKNVKLTPASNDYGIDLIAEKDDIKFAIQCKHYAGKVNNSSIQEANSGKQYYNCHIGVVVTNNYFTPNATFLAKNNGIILWDRKKLITMLKIANDEV